MPKTKRTKTVKRTASRSSSSDMMMPNLNQSYLHKEQAEFHKNHPEANKLIGIFLAAFIVLVAIYLFM